MIGAAASVAALCFVWLDRSLDPSGAAGYWTFGGSAGAAREVLTTIASATMTVLGVTLSITLAVLALTAQGYSPRVLRRFMRDRLVQSVVGGLVGAFAFAIIALRLVREDEVPGITVNVAVLLAFVVLGLLVAFFHHMASEIRVERVIESVWEEAREVIDGLPPLDAGSAGRDRLGPASGEVASRLTGRVRAVGTPQLARIAGDLGVVVEVVPGPGDFVVAGEVLVRVHGRAEIGDEVARTVRDAVELGVQRTMGQDVGYGLRQLGDIALRALSPGINDPTTAEEALLRSADLLRRMADRRLGIRVTGEGGRVLVVGSRPTWDALVGLAFDQVAEQAEAQADAATSLVLLDCLSRVGSAAMPPGRRGALVRRADRVEDGARRALTDHAALERVLAAAERVRGRAMAVAPVGGGAA